mmetsp:Transcript_98382/g.282857  ORF Transcript_98382/g.282857 Transcript_98382/m.282857 type:complete len:387 (-) Transcript_98382:345-1505(-)
MAPVAPHCCGFSMAMRQPARALRAWIWAPAGPMRAPTRRPSKGISRSRPSPEPPTEPLDAASRASSTMPRARASTLSSASGPTRSLASRRSWGCSTVSRQPHRSLKACKFMPRGPMTTPTNPAGRGISITLPPTSPCDAKSCFACSMARQTTFSPSASASSVAGPMRTSAWASGVSPFSRRMNMPICSLNACSRDPLGPIMAPTSRPSSGSIRTESQEALAHAPAMPRALPSSGSPCASGQLSPLGQAPMMKKGQSLSLVGPEEGPLPKLLVMCLFSLAKLGPSKWISSSRFLTKASARGRNSGAEGPMTMTPGASGSLPLGAESTLILHFDSIASFFTMVPPGPMKPPTIQYSMGILNSCSSEGTEAERSRASRSDRPGRGAPHL